MRRGDFKKIPHPVCGPVRILRILLGTCCFLSCFQGTLPGVVIKVISEGKANFRWCSGPFYLPSDLSSIKDIEKIDLSSLGDRLQGTLLRFPELFFAHQSHPLRATTCTAEISPQFLFVSMAFSHLLWTWSPLSYNQHKNINCSHQQQATKQPFKQNYPHANSSGSSTACAAAPLEDPLHLW